MTDHSVSTPAPANDAASNDNRIADDLLFGAEEVAAFLFGAAKQRRRVYHLHAQGVLPTFSMGSSICGRRSTLRAWIEAQEHAGRKAGA